MAVDHFAVDVVVDRNGIDTQTRAVIDIDVETVEAQAGANVLTRADVVTFRNFQAERGDIVTDGDGNQWTLTSRVEDSDRDIDRWFAKKVRT